MEKFAAGLLKNKRKVLCAFTLMLVLSGFLMVLVEINYDLTKYLPEDSMSQKAIAVLEKEFTYPGTAEAMVENVTVDRALEIKAGIEQIEGVKSVMWLDDMVDIQIPIAYQDKAVTDAYYKGGMALYTIEFQEGNYSTVTGSAIDQIRTLYGAKVRGMAEDARNQQTSMMNEIVLIILIVFPLCVFILMLASNSWIEPLLYLIVIGVSIVINMGTNAFFPNVSYLTFSVCAVLQMAISMDYSLFLSHRYVEERDSGKEVPEAIAAAVKGAFSSIFASAFTTFAGFMALIFMGYTIGTDLGIVLAKGITISFLTVIILMPVLLAIFASLIDKTRHRPLIPQFTKLGQAIAKWRYLIIVVAILLVIPAFLGQSRNQFLYGDTSGSSAEGITRSDKDAINAAYGVSNPIIIVTPKDSMAHEKQLADDLLEQKYVKDVMSLATVIPSGMPIAMVPEEVVEQFHSPHYTRYIVSLTIDGENAESFEAAKGMKALLDEKYQDNWYAAGNVMSIVDIKNTVEQDSIKVAVASVLAVALIVLFTFRSISIPILLVLVIESSVWINMSFPYFGGKSLIFIGYLIVSAIQLGATIDYGILITSRYLENRRIHDKTTAVVLAIEKSGGSVVVSALILAVAGFTLGLVSQMSAVADIGILLGRGAALSGAMVLIVLPALIIVFDGLIQKTTLKGEKANEK
ncbi:MAG: MMPL family transporter [Lachnospiraceae bacterium]